MTKQGSATRSRLPLTLRASNLIGRAATLAGIPPPRAATSRRRFGLEEPFAAAVVDHPETEIIGAGSFLWSDGKVTVAGATKFDSGRVACAPRSSALSGRRRVALTLNDKWASDCGRGAVYLIEDFQKLVESSITYVSAEPSFDLFERLAEKPDHTHPAWCEVDDTSAPVSVVVRIVETRSTMRIIEAKVV